MRHVATNPADFWWKPKEEKKQQAKKDSNKAKNQEQQQNNHFVEEADVEDEEVEQDKQDENDVEHWETKATGWTSIVNFIKTRSFLKELLKDLQDFDVANYSGKEYQQGLAKGYLKRLNFNQTNFRLKENKKNSKVIMIQNMKASFEVAKLIQSFFEFRGNRIYFRYHFRL